MILNTIYAYVYGFRLQSTCQWTVRMHQWQCNRSLPLRSLLTTELRATRTLKAPTVSCSNRRRLTLLTSLILILPASTRTITHTHMHGLPKCTRTHTGRTHVVLKTALAVRCSPLGTLHGQMCGTTFRPRKISFRSLRHLIRPPAPSSFAQPLLLQC